MEFYSFGPKNKGGIRFQHVCSYSGHAGKSLEAGSQGYMQTYEDNVLSDIQAAVMMAAENQKMLVLSLLLCTS